MAEVGHAWPTDVNDAIKTAIASYKRVVGEKKRKAIMRIGDGKLPYNLFGYRAICANFMRFLQQGANLGTKVFLHLYLQNYPLTLFIGRSDNIDDILIQNKNWVNDAMTIAFGTTKADLTG